MSTTTIKIHEETKSELDMFREYKNESYDEVIRKVIFVAKKSRKEPKLSQETLKAIDAARERMKKGEFYTAADVRKRLGL
ncbi:MAG: hypothetical protein NT001_06385 [Candidatus Woesearchaeota archaeon]|nr:hypothetical protein [Candidatus Woesearchaeota archaeon]